MLQCRTLMIKTIKIRKDFKMMIFKIYRGQFILQSKYQYMTAKYLSRNIQQFNVLIKQLDLYN